MAIYEEAGIEITNPQLNKIRSRAEIRLQQN